MPSTARPIAGGDRGRRRRPHRDDTEIGRVATPLDTMLDAVDGAHDQAVQAQQPHPSIHSEAANELRTPV
ncbi:sensor histidine kinase, partial [Curtobacterium sp. PsM8]|nr:sensor histidine kinase [Curtobacterium sp. PsM8]